MLRIETLSKTHNRKQFDCGNESLNRYLRQTARQHTEKGIARTFVLINDTKPNDFIAFSQGLLSKFHKIVAKSGFVIKTVQAD